MIVERVFRPGVPTQVQRRDTRLRRVAAQVLGFALIGAALAYGVAVVATVSARSWPAGGSFPALDREDRAWLEGRSIAANETWKTRHSSAIGWDQRAYWAIPSPWPKQPNGQPAPVPAASVRTRAGWPFRIVESEDVAVAPWPSARAYRGGVPIEWQFAGPPLSESALPLAPLWLGLIADAGLYGSLAWVMFVCPRRLHRSIRRWRGLCPDCGYPRGRGVCPECGHAFEASWRRP